MVQSRAQTRAGTQIPVTCFCSKNNRALGSLQTELVRERPFRRTASFDHIASCQDSWSAGPLQMLSHLLKKTEWKFPGHSRESGMCLLWSLGCRADLDNSVLSLDALTEKTHGIICVFLSSELARVTVCGSQADPSRSGRGPTSTSTARRVCPRPPIWSSKRDLPAVAERALFSGLSDPRGPLLVLQRVLRRAAVPSERTCPLCHKDGFSFQKIPNFKRGHLCHSFALCRTRIIEVSKNASISGPHKVCLSDVMFSASKAAHPKTLKMGNWSGFSARPFEALPE